MPIFPEPPGGKAKASRLVHLKTYKIIFRAKKLWVLLILRGSDQLRGWSGLSNPAVMHEEYLLGDPLRCPQIMVTKIMVWPQPWLILVIRFSHSWVLLGSRLPWVHPGAGPGVQRP